MDSIVDIPVKDSKDVGSKSEKGLIISNNWDLSMESDNELEILSCHSQHSIDIDGDLSPSRDLVGNHESTSSISQVARSPSVNSLASRESKAKAVVAGIFELTKKRRLGLLCRKVWVHHQRGSLVMWGTVMANHRLNQQSTHRRNQMG